MTFPRTIETNGRLYTLLPDDIRPTNDRLAVYEYHVGRTWEFISVDRAGNARNHLGVSWVVSAIAHLTDFIDTCEYYADEKGEITK